MASAYAARALRQQQAAQSALGSSLQAKYDNQPANTARSYKSKQQDFQLWCQTTHGEWTDGDTVTEAKLCLWLQEELFLRRVPPRAKKGFGRKAVTKRKRVRATVPALAIGPTVVRPSSSGTVVSQEDLEIAQRLSVPIEDVWKLRAFDHGDVPIDDDDDDDRVEPLPEAGTRYSTSTIDAYVSAVIELYDIQSNAGLNPHPHPRGKSLGALLTARKSGEDGRNRDDFLDRGVASNSECYSDGEFVRMHEYLLRESSVAPGQRLRAHIDSLAAHQMILRGESRRGLELADLSVLEMPPTEGPTPCSVLQCRFSKGKTMRTGKPKYMGVMRHREPLLCTTSALALLLFWRWQVSSEGPPLFRSRQDWYTIKVLIGTDKRSGIAYDTQIADCLQAFHAVGINSWKKTHAGRAEGARAAERNGVSERQISRAGWGDHEVMTTAYLTGLPIKFLRTMAGFEPRPGSFYLARATHQPPEALRRCVWPWVEEWEERVRRRGVGMTWEQGGLDQDDVALKKFLHLLQYLRTVLLQDLAALQPQFPGLPQFVSPLFSRPDWKEFAGIVQATNTQEDLPRNVLLERSVPEVVREIATSRDAVLQSVIEHHNRTIAELTKRHEEALLFEREMRRQWEDYWKSTVLTVTASRTYHQRPGAPPPPMEPISWAPVQFGPLGHTPTPPTTTTTTTTTIPAPVPTATTTSSWVAPERSDDDSVSQEVAPPSDCLWRAASTVSDVWREWEEGIRGKPPIKSLEERWGPRWRRNGATKVEWCRRKKILDAIRRHTAQKGVPTDVAIRRLDEIRAGRSLSKLVKLLLANQVGY